MKTTISIIALLASLASCSHSTGNAHEDAPSDTIEAVPDTLPQGKALNDIRFEGWSRSQWLDNDYIRTVRRYLDDYTAGKETNPDLDPYREQVKSKFVIYDITPYIVGGAIVRIVFLDLPDRVFSCWVYSTVNEDKETVESYEFRSIHIEDEHTDFTRGDLLQAVKEVDGLKLW